MFLQQELSFRTRHHLCRQGVALVSTRQLRLQSPVCVHEHRTEEVTESEGQEKASGVWGGVGVAGGNGDGNRDGGGNGGVSNHGDGDGAGAGTGTGVEVNEGAQDGNGDGSGDGAITIVRTGVEIRGRSQDGNGDRKERRFGDGRERGWDWGGWRRGEEAQETAQEL